MDVPTEVSTLILTGVHHTDIGWLSLVNRSAADQDAVWNAKLRKLGYPSVPCPQMFYALVTSIRYHDSTFAALINLGIVAHLKAYIQRYPSDSLATCLDYRAVDSISPEMRAYLLPFFVGASDEDCISRLQLTMGVSNDLFDLLIEAIEPGRRAEIVSKLYVSSQVVVNTLPILAKYRLGIPLIDYTTKDIVRILLALPWVSHSIDLNQQDLVPFIKKFEAAYKRQPAEYQRIMDAINAIEIDEESSSSSASKEVTTIPVLTPSLQPQRRSCIIL